MATKEALKPAWYVLHTKSRFENVVNEGLANKSFEAFLPKVRVRSKRRDRKLLIRVPLFPGYLFVKTDLDPYAHLEILKTVGAVRLIGNRQGPISVRDDTVDSIRIMAQADQPVITGSRFKKGDQVIVLRGPFQGVCGTFVRYRGSGRVVVNVEALGQWAAVEVDGEDVETFRQILPR